MRHYVVHSDSGCPASSDPLQSRSITASIRRRANWSLRWAAAGLIPRIMAASETQWP